MLNSPGMPGVSGVFFDDENIGVNSGEGHPDGSAVRGCKSLLDVKLHHVLKLAHDVVGIHVESEQGAGR